MAFLVVTIAGERLELTRFLNTPPLARRLFAGIVVFGLRIDHRGIVARMTPCAKVTGQRQA